MTKGSQTLGSLAADYTDWQKRGEALGAEEKKADACRMALTQEAEEGEGDPQALQTTKADCMDLKQRLEAAGAKMKDLYGSALSVAAIENEARYRAASETQDALNREYQEKCKQAAVHLVQVMSILEDLAIHPENLVKILGLDTNSPFAKGDEVLSEAYGQAKRSPLTPRDSEWVNTHRQRQNDLIIFLSSWVFNRISVNHQTVNAAIRAAGGQPPMPKPVFGEREKAYVGM